MMMLGLVIHSVITYSIRDYEEAWPLKDPLNTGIHMDIMVDWIHHFRMPAFFLIAGFFGALLFYERSPQRMITNRISRIVWPFIVFVLILWPLVRIPLGFGILKSAGAPASFNVVWKTTMEESILPGNTGHLWFLYYLIMISFSFWAMGLLLKRAPALTRNLSRLFEATNRNSLVRPLLLALPVFACLFFMQYLGIVTSIAWFPDLATFCVYALFYGYGWTLYHSRELLPGLAKNAWLLFAIGMILFTIRRILMPQAAEKSIFMLLMVMTAITICLFVFSIIGLFLKYANHHSPRMRYISDASYWVYLIHLPFCMLIPWFMLELNIPATIKALIVFCGATTVSFISYHYCVRSTFIGQFLNGRKFPNTRVIAETPSPSSQK